MIDFLTVWLICGVIASAMFLVNIFLADPHFNIGSMRWSTYFTALVIVLAGGGLSLFVVCVCMIATVFLKIATKLL